jgi:hypothetical protein
VFTLAKCAVGVPPFVCDWSGLELKLAGSKFRVEV